VGCSVAEPIVGACVLVLCTAACQEQDGPLRFCDLAQRFAPPSSRLTADGRLLRDTASRQVVLRGVNAGGRSKLPPFFPFEFRESGQPDQVAAPSFADALRAYVDRLASWGINVVRLPWSWEGLEPTRGTIDETYLARYVEMVRAFGARGIRIIVELHQDVFARPYCGDGFPLWACPQPLPPAPASCAAWYSGYSASPDVDAAFDRFWRNEDGLQDAFIAAWRRVAARTWSVEQVIGFDVLNEPHPGTAEKKLWAEKTLRPFYERLAAELRAAAAPSALIIVEPTGMEGPVTATDLPRPDGSGLVLAPHYYSPIVFLTHAWSEQVDLLAPTRSWDGVAASWGVPFLLGEYGMVASGSGVCDYVRAQQDALDQVGGHGTIWEASMSKVDWNDEGYGLLRPEDGAERPAVAALVRAYPRAIACTLRAFSFDPRGREGTLEWEAKDGVTEIVAPARLYPEGVTARLEGAQGCAVWDATRELLIVATRAAATAKVGFGPGQSR
jgi:endoglycosylceramidase